MSEIKRILPWEDDDWNWFVDTKIGRLAVIRCDEFNEWVAKWGYEDDEVSYGRYATKEQAMAVMESAYISRCTEFLRLVGDGEVVISRGTALGLMLLANTSCYRSGVIEKSVENLTAAIDAAGGGK